MDLYDLTKFGKKVKTTDTYWVRSLSYQDDFEKAVKEGTDEDMYNLIRSPNLYKGRS